LIFYSTIINSSERESTYVLDGLLHTDEIQSDIHSTDTHGFSEVIFGIMYLLGIYFAPRIKNIQKQKLYAFDPEMFDGLGYKIIPTEKINIKLIEDNWINILRFISTIKLREALPSQLIKRLNSYSSKHPLYNGLREFGRLPKSLFIPNYYDDLKLRQSIEKQLNKGENTNKFGGAVSFGNRGELNYATKEEQEIAIGCKRLIENASICWNYLYLSNLILKTTSEIEKNKIIETIKNGSILIWRHINYHGEYDYSSDIEEKEEDFDIAKILDLKII
jgi:TnpA family transposase